VETAKYMLTITVFPCPFQAKPHPCLFILCPNFVPARTEV